MGWGDPGRAQKVAGAIRESPRFRTSWGRRSRGELSCGPGCGHDPRWLKGRQDEGFLGYRDEDDEEAEDRR